MYILFQKGILQGFHLRKLYMLTFVFVNMFINLEVLHYDSSHSLGTAIKVGHQIYCLFI